MSSIVEHDALLDELTETEAQIAYWQARQLQTIAALAEHPLPLPSHAEAMQKRWVREEIACELKLSPTTASWRLAMACDLTGNAPQLVKLLETGQISMRYLYAFTDLTRHLDDQHKQAVAEKVIDRAGDQAISSFKRSVKRAVMAVAPTTTDQQETDALAQRRVTGREGEHGVSTVFAILPDADQAAVLAAIDTLARHWASLAGETRTLEQLRADAYVHLICRNADGIRPGPVINVCIALSTLIGEDDQPAELADTTPISAAQARLLAHDPTSTWRRLITDPHGQLLDYGRSTYRPPAPLARFVQARDRHCTFPHCTRPATRCDLDHRHDWVQGGTTSPCNLHPLCERHHNAKHTAGWTVHLLPGRITQWTSPTGRTYHSQPPPYPTDTTRQAPED